MTRCLSSGPSAAREPFGCGALATTVKKVFLASFIQNGNAEAAGKKRSKVRRILLGSLSAAAASALLVGVVLCGEFDPAYYTDYLTAKFRELYKL